MAHFATITVLRRSQLVNSAFSSPRVARHQDIPAASFVFISTLDSEILPHFTGGTSDCEASEPLPGAETRLADGSHLTASFAPAEELIAAIGLEP